MPAVFRCPQGHRWELPTDAPSAARPVACPVCGADIEPPHDITEAETIPPAVVPAATAETASVIKAIQDGPAPAIAGYEILGELGRGGMGLVYRARQPHLDRLVAIKVLPAEARNDTSFTERFTREARALARLNHPNILTVYDFGQADGQSYFVMEYVDGSNLRQRLQGGPLGVGDALHIIHQVCEALQYAHDEGIVHRDIKPENVLLDRKGRVKIADFGIAKLLTRKTGEYTLTGPWQVMGTWHYMAPEQLENPQQLDHRADIYAVGVMLYELLTGGLPQGHFPLPSEKRGTDPQLDAIVLKAMAKEPDRRYQHASELKAAIEACQLADAKTMTGLGSFARPVADATAVLSSEISLGTAETWVARVHGPARWLMIAGLVALWPTVLYWLLRGVGVIAAPGSDPRALFSRETGIELITVIPALFAGMAIAGSLALYHRRAYLIAVIGSMVAVLNFWTMPLGMIAGVRALITLLRPSIRRAYRLPQWPPSSQKLPPLAPAWMTSVTMWSMVCCAIGLVSCLQPGRPWIRVMANFDIKAAEVYGYQSSYGLATASLFVLLFLWLLATGRMRLAPVWNAVAITFTGLAALVLVLVALQDASPSAITLTADVRRQLTNGQLRVEHMAPLYSALAMALSLLLLGTLQLRLVLAAWRPPEA